MDSKKPMRADEIAADLSMSIYPEPFASMMKGRTKRRLGNYFGLTNFGVNLTELAPGAKSALKHTHEKQDEFIYVVRGTPTLSYGDSEHVMQPGDCIEFKCGSSDAHQLVNRTGEKVVYLEIGDRTPGDRVEYPNDDLVAKSAGNGRWIFYQKNGEPYRMRGLRREASQSFLLRLRHDSTLAQKNTSDPYDQA